MISIVLLSKTTARHTESKLYLLGAGTARFPLASQKALFDSLEIKLIGIFVGSAVACSRRSDSGERCEVKRSAKKYKRGRGRVPLYFSSLSLLRTALHYLNAWNRLVQLLAAQRVSIIFLRPNETFVFKLAMSSYSFIVSCIMMM